MALPAILAIYASSLAVGRGSVKGASAFLMESHCECMNAEAIVAIPVGSKFAAVDTDAFAQAILSLPLQLSTMSPMPRKSTVFPTLSHALC